MNSQAPERTAEKVTKENQDPKILVFACRYCPLIGAEEAGRQRLDIQENFRVISVECISRVEPDAVVRAFSLGIDGVAVLGCHLGGCRYHEANHRSVKQMKLLAILLDTTGIDSRRLLTSYGTAHEAHQFAGLIHGFAGVLEKLPNLSSARRAGTNGRFGQRYETGHAGQRV
ncbi:MvhD4 [Desulforapulum autotrophicum HRM2]|uniref:MvhD4 n=1 Tax=Desulforapulum autotrophicum (strain ATCC 43914 / DSM 3382 / VKM B-1955 / HRM2) TaxID=177437 RepID=C0Q9I0_DESAH|nr:hydrogenase iron-sulfur subunit [Desulforapulum autotrophicum]ACN14544.1 MvhD4 [Desulforapulum autotrophicum HRM2]